MSKVARLVLAIAVTAGASSLTNAREAGGYLRIEPVGIGYSSFQVGDYRFGGTNYFTSFALGYKAQSVTIGMFGNVNLLPYILSSSNFSAAKLSSGTVANVELQSNARILNLSLGANLGFNLDSYTGSPLTISLIAGVDRFGIHGASITGVNAVPKTSQATTPPLIPSIPDEPDLNNIYSEAIVVGGRIDGTASISQGISFEYVLGYSYGIRSRLIYSADKLGFTLFGTEMSEIEQTSGYHAINASLGLSWDLGKAILLTSSVVGNYKLNGASSEEYDDDLTFPKTSYFDIGFALGVEF